MSVVYKIPTAAGKWGVIYKITLNEKVMGFFLIAPLTLVYGTRIAILCI